VKNHFGVDDSVFFIDAHKILEIRQFCVPYVPPTSDFVGLERVLIMIIISTSFSCWLDLSERNNYCNSCSQTRVALALSASGHSCCDYNLAACPRLSL
jgi:hypothetical protein